MLSLLEIAAEILTAVHGKSKSNLNIAVGSGILHPWTFAITAEHPTKNA